MSNQMEAVLEPSADARAASLSPDAMVDAGAATGCQFVTFHVADETFAVPLTDVQEIIRLPDMVEVPMAAACLKGLANLRGSVLPVVNLRNIFQIDDIPYDDATRVVVMSDGRPAGFIVDRMSSVVTAEPREIEAMDTLRATIDNEMLTGMIKREKAMIMMLDTSKLMSALGSLKSVAGTAGAGDAAMGGRAAEDEAAAAAIDEIQLVSFELDHQEYALPIESVQEIVQVPETITKVANAQSHVLGVMNLRDRLLPLVSLRTLFGLEAAAVDDQSRIVVVTHQIDGGSHSVGLVTDTVKEVLRVPRALVDPIPNLLSSGAGFREIDQICRMDGGQRLVSIVLPDRLFSSTEVRAALDEVEGLEQDETMNASTAVVSDGLDDEEQFVIFRVADEEYGVPIHSVQEIVRIPDQLTRIPKAPAFIEGVVNLRGAVLPVIDQRRRFDLPSIEANERQRIMVFTLDGLRTGFIVDSVSEVLKISRTQISDAPDIATNAASAVAKVANIIGLKRMILMLDVDQLLNKAETRALEKLN